MNGSDLRWFSAFYKRHIGNEWRFLSLGRSVEYVPLFSDDVLDLLGVRFVVVDNDRSGSMAHLADLRYPAVRVDSTRTVYENTGGLDRAFVVGAIIDGSGLPAERGARNTEAATTTDAGLLEHADRLGVARQGGTAVGRAHITEYKNGTVEIDARLDRAGILVVMDAWHPGWSASVNGEAAYIGRVNESFRGVALPAGNHTIVMTYRPRLFLESIALAGLGSLLLIAMVGVLSLAPTARPATS